MSLTGGQPNFARSLTISCAGTLYIHFLGLLLPDGILLHAKFTLRSSLAFTYSGSVTARHSSSGLQPNCGMVRGMELRNFCRGCHLYLALWPSRWASAHILVSFTCDVNMTSLPRTWHWSAATVSAACMAKLGAVADWWLSWPMANVLTCLCSCQWWTFWTYLVNVNLLSLYLMNFVSHHTWCSG